MGKFTKIERKFDQILAEYKELKDTMSELTKNIVSLNSAVWSINSSPKSLPQSDTTRKRPAHPVSTAVLQVLSTAKQHATVQMLINQKPNAKIAEVMGVTENTAKVHVRTVAKKLGVKKRHEIVFKLAPAMETIDPKSYQTFSGGLPKDWFEKYSLNNKPGYICPFKELYHGKKNKK